jgi:hypothetical protein
MSISKRGATTSIGKSDNFWTLVTWPTQERAAVSPFKTGGIPACVLRNSATD